MTKQTYEVSFEIIICSDEQIRDCQIFRCRSLTSEFFYKIFIRRSVRIYVLAPLGAILW